jgi:hypothetical protein
MSWAPGTTLPAGLLEHLATVALSVWLLVFAIRLRGVSQSARALVWAE